MTERWVTVEELTNAGVPLKTIHKRIADFRWAHHVREDDGTIEFLYSTLPMATQSKLIKPTKRSPRDKVNPNAETTPYAEFHTKAQFHKFPGELQRTIQDAFSKLFEERMAILRNWSELPDREKQNRGSSYAKGWVYAAHRNYLSDCYPTLLIFPLPRELDRLASGLRAAKSPQDAIQYLINLDIFRLDTASLRNLKESALG